MSVLPASGYISNAARTNAEQKLALEELRDAIAESLGGAARSELTISGGAIVPPDGSGGGVHTIDTEGNAASDDLTNITTTNTPEGRILLLQAENVSRVVTVKNAAGGAGQITMQDSSDFIFRSLNDWLMVQRRSTDWVELARSRAPCRFFARPSSDQTTVTTSTYVDVQFATEDEDVGSNFASHKFTAPYAGWFQLSACIQTTTLIADGALFIVRLVTDGGTVLATELESRGGSGANILGVSYTGPLTFGDVVGVEVFHTHGSDVTLDATSTNARMYFSGIGL